MDNPNEIVLQMCYHPAKKEVKFAPYKIVNGGPIKKNLEANSELTKYVNEKGRFILQHHGNKFFDDIYSTFGRTEIKIKLFTTEADFEDFQRMVEYYNRTPDRKCKITAAPGKVTSPGTLYLAEMDQIYKSVQEFGREAIRTLDNQDIKLGKIKSNSDSVREIIDKATGNIKEANEQITEAVNHVGDNCVNLCFAGVYSSGKSELINALLGHRILPTDDDSTTARIFCIKSPTKGQGDVPTIQFSICEVGILLVWNEKRQIFNVKCERSNPQMETKNKIDNLLGEIEKGLQENQKCSIQVQMYHLLSLINHNEDVGTQIDIRFPIPFDTNRVQFAIYDTPGTNSKHKIDLEILQEALAKQINSILVFVFERTGMEGAGIHTLLSYLRAGQEDCKTAIDISRSLYVMNKADNVTKRQSLENVHENILEDEEKDMSIPLSEQKLLLTSAAYASVAKGKKRNGVLSDDDTRIYKKAVENFEAPGWEFYRYNRCATSEYATQRMIDRSDKALQKAIDAGDEAEKIYVASGMYALASEIQLYGEKSAPAVRAFAIIDSIEKAVSEIGKTVGSIAEDTETLREKMAQEIESSRTSICGDIQDIITSRMAKILSYHMEIIDKDTLYRLHLNDEYYADQLSSKIDRTISKEFNTLFGNDKDWKFKIGTKKLNGLIKKLSENFDAWYYEYRSGYQSVLKGERTDTINAIKEKIMQHSELGQRAKDLICDIKEPKIIKADNIRSLEKIYKDNRYEKRFLWMHTDYINAEKFKEEAKKELRGIWKMQQKWLQEDYVSAYTDLMKKIEKNFVQNIDDIALQLRAMIEGKKSMEQLCDSINATVGSLNKTLSELDDAIWTEKKAGTASTIKNALLGLGSNK